MKVEKFVYKAKPVDKQSRVYKKFMKVFKAYKKFVEVNKRLPMQSSANNIRPKSEIKLYQWANGKKNRASKRLLAEWQYELLCTIPGFTWSTQSNVWFNMLTNLSEYMLKYNETPTQLRPERFPERIHKGKWISPVDDKLHRLSVWCMVQRNAFRRGTLLPDRMNALIDIGFDFEPGNGPAHERGNVPGMDSIENIKYLKNKQKHSWRYE